jgi:hypothetical protein
MPSKLANGAQLLKAVFFGVASDEGLLHQGKKTKQSAPGNEGRRKNRIKKTHKISLRDL